MDHQLQVFITVAERKNFSRAAEDLHMTQPAVSQYIRSFEEAIGVRLLERTNKYVRLNQAGEIVYHHGKEIVGLYSKMQNLVDDLTNKASGSLHIGASYTFGEYVLPHILSKLVADYPSIEPAITIGNTAEIAEQVISHQLDVGLIEGHFKEAVPLQNDSFAEDAMYIVTSPTHPLAQADRRLSINELANDIWLLREEGSGTREAAETFFLQSGFYPSRTMKFSSTQPIKESVEAGLGISLLSQWAIQKELHYGDLAIIPVKGTPFKRNFSIVTNSPFQTKALQVFIDLLKNSEELTVLHKKTTDDKE
ncbi:LysR family transcriptional regulator [Sporosarcina sp. PTS2304]|uniref:LysR family transcriptional regulator n=1 Tax=Sporosarcina sp. PTS2304 TaxID=2283194 RepID=UPI000E0D89A2|nr:LysR family transcriptional regulator [Sporosarcina sp. PTS2304]AXI01227.1 LysR family transcriptional regulator [Sporosarcina sp. PTS2304]